MIAAQGMVRDSARKCAALKKEIMLMKAVMLKKGVVFSLIAIMVIAFLVIVFSGNLLIPLNQDVSATQARVNALDRFVQRFPWQVSVATKVQGQQAFEQLSETLLLERAYVTDVQAAFNACLMNGTVLVQGNPLVQDCGTMRSQTLLLALETLANTSTQALHMNLTYNFSSFIVTQQTPFEVIVQANLTYIVGDEVAQWNRTVPLSATLEIAGVTDPYYAVELASPAYTINPTQFTSWNLTNFQAFLANKQYRYQANGTMFLDRYTHSVQRSDCCGIESVIDPAVANDPVFSSVDKQFFEKYPYPCDAPDTILYNVSGIDTRLRLSGESILRYNVSDQATQVCG